MTDQHRVIQRLEQLRPPTPDAAAMRRLRTALHNEYNKREVSRSPLRMLTYASVCIAAALIAFVTLTPHGTQAPHETPVQFVFVAPAARHVNVVGDFNNWDANATPLAQENGVWSVVVQLPAGRQAYSFVVDESEWHSDPRSPLRSESFGLPSSVLFVSAESQP